ncbi:MAG: peptidoglycan DD-metalloendopeptidase family protein [Chitinophagaceae bacterium]|nr:peptidoglycan DD-metalloendopeptidase family protein [Chitinophagaceae bacterium]HQV06271.1 peptidoglycan DD-metalloendopeptidase family protein [Chitinophagaceae bacterium]
MMKKIAFTLLFTGIFLTVFSQPIRDKTKLNNERADIQNELKEIQKLYDKVKGQTRLTIGQLAVLNRKINLQEDYISNINNELRIIDDNIYLSELEIYRLNKQIDTLKAEYARTVVYAYKNRSSYDYLNFIFSATSFNDAIKRIAYLKSYRNYRQKKVQIILETQKLIAERKKQQLARKQLKKDALENKEEQIGVLAKQKEEKAATVASLKTKGKELGQQIAAKKKKDRDLQNAILAIVNREKAAAEAEAKRKRDALAKIEKQSENSGNNAKKDVTINTPEKKTNISNVAEDKTNKPVDKPEASKPINYLDLNAKDVALNNSFEANKARLPWPVDNGIVTFTYGKNTIDNLAFDNPGITITTPSQGVPVKAVFDGEVRGIFNLGDGKAVIIRHGKYFTSYSNLSNVSVSKGQMVKTGQQIGTAGSNEAGNAGQIEFILMVGTSKVNPRPWLR